MTTPSISSYPIQFFQVLDKFHEGSRDYVLCPGNNMKSLHQLRWKFYSLKKSLRKDTLMNVETREKYLQTLESLQFSIMPTQDLAIVLSWDEKFHITNEQRKFMYHLLVLKREMNSEALLLEMALKDLDGTTTTPTGISRTQPDMSLPEELPQLDTESQPMEDFLANWSEKE